MTQDKIEAAIRRLNTSERGQAALSTVLDILDDGYLHGLDSENQAAFIMLVSLSFDYRLRIQDAIGETLSTGRLPNLPQETRARGGA